MVELGHVIQVAGHHAAQVEHQHELLAALHVIFARDQVAAAGAGLPIHPAQFVIGQIVAQ